MRRTTLFLMVVLTTLSSGETNADENETPVSAVADDGESAPAQLQLTDGSEVITEPVPDPDVTKTTFEETIVEVVSDLDACESCESTPLDASSIRFGDWVGYNAAQSNTTWLADDELGMVSFESFPTLEFGDDSELLFGSGFHFVNGPRGDADLPPRLFDLQLAYHTREAIIAETMLDIKYSVGVFSDFEGSARKGVRFPGHVVGYNAIRPDLAAVLGLEILDRDDISVLPVTGFVWRPDDDLIIEAIFPKPRVSLHLGKQRAIYFAGELGGGTWAVQRDSGANDNATYRDLRVVFGIQRFGDDDEYTTEIGWAFDRSLEYRSGVGNTDFDGAFILRFHRHF
ncbi:MAG: hypothetical protein AAF802_12160 [Planctomycetota bacterium]